MKAIALRYLLVSSIFLGGCVALDDDCGPWRTGSIDASLVSPAKLSIVGNSFSNTVLTTNYQRSDHGRLSAEAELVLRVNGVVQERHNLTDPQCPRPQPYIAYEWRLLDTKRVQDVLAIEVSRRGTTLFQHDVDLRPFSVAGIPTELPTTKKLSLRYPQPTIRTNEMLTMWAAQDRPNARGAVIQEWSATDLSDGLFQVNPGALDRLPSGRVKIWFVRNYRESLQSGSMQTLIAYSTLGSTHFIDKK